MLVNIRSVITSGLVSGLLINISAISMVPVVGNEMDLVLASRGLPPLSNMAMLFFSMISFIFGISQVWLYVLVKEHLGSGIKTAVIVSLVFWFLTYFLSNVSLVVYGFMPVKLTVIGTAWGLGELILASIVGSKLYKEVKNK
jgi:hypothetical protein